MVARRCSEKNNGPTPMERLCKGRRPGRAKLNSLWDDQHETQASGEKQERKLPSNSKELTRDDRKQWREMTRKIQIENLSLEVVHPDAAGIDIGNQSHYVAVTPTRDNQPVRRFECTTAELKEMAVC
jgi:hypothetical protein